MGLCNKAQLILPDSSMGWLYRCFLRFGRILLARRGLIRALGMKKMTRCWAEALGDCEGGLSREHIFSHSILKEFAGIYVRGFPWCRDELRVIGRKAFVTKRLCRKHNSALSPADAAALALFRGLLQGALHGTQENADVEVNGTHIESWFMKTAINAMATEPEPPRWRSMGLSMNPPLDLVQSAFGIVRLRPPMGLYMIPSAGPARDELSIQCLNLEDGTIASVIASVRGCRFLLSLDPNGWPIAEEKESIVFGPERGPDFYYRPDAIGVVSMSGAKGIVRLRWR